MTYGDKIRSMNDKELAEFLSECVISDNEGEAMFICGIGHFVWAEDLADKLGEEIKNDSKLTEDKTVSDKVLEQPDDTCRDFKKMVAIKGIRMSKDCDYWDVETRKWKKCPIYKSCKHHTSDIDVKPSDCPMVEAEDHEGEKWIPVVNVDDSPFDEKD